MSTDSDRDSHHYRFHLPLVHMGSVYGDDWFGVKAEAFARIFGTPKFLLTQTAFIAAWITLHALGYFDFDPYPYILLNLAFSLQAAYAAPLILLAQTRQADRDKAHSEADALHREDLATASEQRELIAQRQNERLLELMEQNTQLTEVTRQLSERIETLTREIHDKLAAK